MDLCGREWSSEEFETFEKEGMLTSEDIEVIEALVNSGGHWHCQRCLNKNQTHFAQFRYKGKEITYCRDCLDFKMMSSESLLYRSQIKHDIPSSAGELNADFKLSFLQQQASNFTQKLLKNGEVGLIWAVCDASV